MALFPDYNPQNLEDVLKNQAQTASSGIQDTAAQNRKRTISMLGHTGQLMGGTADYPLTDLDTQEASQLSGVQDSLANALGNVPAESYTNQNQFNRQLDLAKYIGSLMQPSTLDEVFQGIGAATNIGSKAAAASAMF